MNIIFVGRDNSFNRRLVSELLREHHILCYIFVEKDLHTFRGNLRKIRQRMHRYGFFRVANEMAYHVLDRCMIRRGETQALIRDYPDYFVNTAELNAPAYYVDNVHDQRWLDLVRGQAPDIIFSVCCSVIFKPELYSIPKMGTYIVHEGLAPEYKGLHTILWALLKQDDSGLGYTVLKANSSIDGGDILVQGGYALQPGETYKTWSMIGHKSIIEGAPKIRDAFRELEQRGTFTPVPKTGRANGYYTWMTLSAFVYWRYIQRPLKLMIPGKAKRSMAQ